MPTDPSVATNAVLWSGLVGFFLPLAISIIIQTNWPSNAKAGASFCASLIAAFGTAYFSGLLDPQDVARCFLVTFTIAVASYTGLWKPTGIAPKLESITSFGSGS